MEIRKLGTWQEWLESDRITSTAFLHKWDEKKAEEECKAQANGEKPRNELAWGLFGGNGDMCSTIVTMRGKMIFDGSVVDVGDVHMVGSLPEARGNGNIRELMRAVLEDFKNRGDLFAVLHPFSFAFYRKFGFELVSKTLEQKAPIDQFAEFRCDYAVKQMRSDEDTAVLRKLYEAFIMDKNLAELREEKDWKYRGNGEFGEPNWWHGDRQSYTYIFTGSDGKPHAYFKFRFIEDPQEHMVGTLEADDFVYDSPEAFRNVLGFIYGMRAKVNNVRLELLDTIDLSTLLPECDKVQRKLGGHLMGRVLDPEKVLALMKHPEDSGSYTVHIEDSFLTENTGTYAVSYKNGRAVSVEKTNAAADFEISNQTFCQLALGIISPAEAEYRDGTKINSNGKVLEQVFVKKIVCG